MGDLWKHTCSFLNTVYLKEKSIYTHLCLKLIQQTIYSLYRIYLQHRVNRLDRVNNLWIFCQQIISIQFETVTG